ncbi:MAG: CgeB family protein [Caulobacteraceae bacterium]
MKVFVIGKAASITHWLEQAASGLRAAGHEVRVGIARDPARHPAIDSLLASERLGAPLARAIVAAVRRFAPDLILAIGAFHVPVSVLARLRALAARPPLVGWVGDRFSPAAAGHAGLFDLLGYTDSGLLARHLELGFPGQAMFLPHAVDPSAAEPRNDERRRRMVFVANPTPHRRALLAGLARPVDIYGPGWSAFAGVDHLIHSRRIAPGEVRRVYRSALAALDIRNEANVIDGLNQRNFEPCLAAAAVVSDAQPDLARCFDPGSEVLVYEDVEALNAIHERLDADPAFAAAVGRAGRRRVLADHTYARRLEAIASQLR